MCISTGLERHPQQLLRCPIVLLLSGALCKVPMSNYTFLISVPLYQSNTTVPLRERGSRPVIRVPDQTEDRVVLHSEQ